MGDECNKSEHKNTIKPINVDTVHKICSGQVVLSLAIAVKELLENSLDAGATNIEIRFKNHGIDLIEVTDNGSGITHDNYEALALKYHTSKISDYSDLLGVTSFGFRGEALSSLCALANLTVTTRHKTDQYATKIEYDLKGNITKKTPCSRQIGTTVSLTNLFHSLPVRQKEFHKNAKREFNKMTQLLYAYCLISSGVKITCSNQTSSNSKSLVVATHGSTLYKDNISCVFGVKQLQTILEIKPEYVSNIKDNIFKGLSGDFIDTEESIQIEDVEIDLSEDSNEAEPSEPILETQKSQGHKNVAAPVEFTGFISSCAHGSGRSSTDRQFFYVNKRPCEPTKVIKLVNEIYRQYNPNQHPFVFLNVNLDRTCVDVNVTPDKRQIFLTKEKIILDVLKNSLLKLFENIPRILKVETPLYGQETNNTVKAELGQPRVFNSFLQKFSKYKSDLEYNANNVESKQELKRKSTSMLDYLSAKSAKTNSDSIDEEPVPVQETNANKCTDHDLEYGTVDTNLNVDNISVKLEKDINLKSGTSKSFSNDDRPVLYLESDNMPNTQIRDLADIIVEKSHSTNCKTKSIDKKVNLSTIRNEVIAKKSNVATDQADLGKNNRKTITITTSLEHVKAMTEIYHKDKTKTTPTKVKFRSVINPVFNKKCEEELSKEISKDSFKEMKVIGQFNLGFIITKLEDDLFIIDQHATDEIYNFETLQKTTELTSQKLVIPQQLELTGVNEQILMDSLEVFKKNGFTFDVNEDALPTKRVKLLTIPMSKNWVFGKEDIEELLFMLRESPTEYCRPSRVRAMFASRACRKSVMIGTALSKADMKTLVDHMADIDKPWNCPHGRPTIRHLVNLAMVHTRDNCD